MFWAEELLQGKIKKNLINDAWTPSGIIHMGGLKGPIIHDTLSRILKIQGKDVRFTFGFDDMDAIDGLPQNLKESYGRYMGIPICNAPSPDGNGTFGEYYGNIMRDLFKKLDISAEIYLASDYYRNGIYNKAIEHVLNNADKVRKVYSDIYKKKIERDWFPLQVICPECGKIGTTKVTGWDGLEVEFECSKSLVKWAEGCGRIGKISPFNGLATMPFKVEWASKWWIFGVTIEGAGKDHASAGGAYDVARKICKDVFGQEPPIPVPYEFFLYDGKKMSSSRGVGLNTNELLEVISPQMVRFLMIKTKPNLAIEFNPYQTQIIPKLYDDYQRFAQLHKIDPRSEGGLIFELSQIGITEKVSSIRFATLAQWVQMPNMEEKIKKENLEKWAGFARIWVDRYASESEKFNVQKEIPKTVNTLSDKQKEFLIIISKEIDNHLDPENLQKYLYDIGKDLHLSSKDTFAAIYISFIGKDHGPKAGWLLLSLDKNFVKQRCIEVSRI
ncbi:lysine--tRNA ligase [Candidatus Levyibacteriota bacterium]|nr:lysine--tRNA ligase [Candidatus Levybacteria bacterium]